MIRRYANLGMRALRLCGEQSGVWKMPTWILRSLRSQSCGAVINSDLKIRRPMSRGPEAVRSWKFLPGVNTKLGTASSIYNRAALAKRFIEVQINKFTIATYDVATKEI